MSEVRNNRSFNTQFVDVGGRNPRDVWRLKSTHFPDEHFATFPLSLPTRCILASTSEAGVCGNCGAPWARVVEKPKVGSYHSRSAEYGRRQPDGGPSNSYEPGRTVGWRPTCSHDAPAVPAVVLDPFVGSGTTCIAAKQLGRRSIGVDLSEPYLKMAVQRLHQLALA